MSQKRGSALGVFACAVMTFSFLTSEMLPIGLLPRIARSLAVSVPDAGLLLTAYAFVVTIAGPPLTARLGRVPRKRLLLVLAGALVVSTALCGIADTYASLLAARLLNALAHGVFWAIVASSAASIVAPARRGVALATIYAGSSVGIVLGVPIATFVGERLGWHAAFGAVAALAVVAFAILATMPSMPPAKPSALGDIPRLLADGAFVRLLLTTTLVVIGSFTAFTYFTPLFAPVAAHVTGGVPTLLLVDGIAGFASTSAFGVLAHRRSVLAIVVAAVIIMVALGALAACDRTGRLSPAAAIAIVALWGIGTGGAARGASVPALAVSVGGPLRSVGAGIGARAISISSSIGGGSGRLSWTGAPGRPVCGTGLQ